MVDPSPIEIDEHPSIAKMPHIDPVPTNTKFVYLEPELGQKVYITIGFAVFTSIVIGLMIWGFKQYWERGKNKCDLGPTIGTFFGSSYAKWIEDCVKSPLEGNYLEIQMKNQMKRAKITNKYKSIFERVKDELMMIMTKARLASSNLKIAKKNI